MKIIEKNCRNKTCPTIIKFIVYSCNMKKTKKAILPQEQTGLIDRPFNGTVKVKRIMISLNVKGIVKMG